MSGLLTTVEDLFQTRDLYQVLGLTSEASPAQLKKGYHKRSLTEHPDRNPHGDQKRATAKFQTLSAVYAILSDPDARALYDETGEIHEELESTLNPPDKDWNQYWRLLFKKITVTDIAEFEAKYKESEEELADLKAAYLEGQGDMNFILDNVLCCNLDDEARFTSILQDLISQQELPDYKKFSRESTQKKKQRKRRLDGEKVEAEAYAQELGLGDGQDALKNLIMKRQAQREKDSDSFLDQLAAKYAQPKAKAKGKKK
ncbi:hypothetical protein TCAL_06614 [Tigriopus californicus]|uniref:J domain-containing protein n=1 Tax=Tigriopus californicus TaxID=6832 RepID=A0A553PLU8_TIGCA|nr:dnaJ homolog subfamily C member 9-like [Tigriopus californicus]TRY78652.1 hypothetical protein TCAL_06614 [Tigriopus californicus]|eukprot:TCALIF_06614-PA protein Name:"Similar to Dnajc9 DnaJ homolog subfamily C member 9 (Mus musculus)" AED:0.05 eAED:0.05 QI:70/1/1/1/1/1/3/117/257